MFPPLPYLPYNYNRVHFQSQQLYTAEEVLAAEFHI